MWNKRRMAREWPMLLVPAGLALFALACLYSTSLPVETIFVGPLMMAAGVALKELNKRESPERENDAPSRTAPQR